MNQHPLLLTSTMPCEIGTGALFATLLPTAKHVIVKIDDAQKADSTLQVLESHSGSDRVVMIGTYWQKCIDVVAQRLPAVYFSIFCFGSFPPHTEHKNVTYLKVDSLEPDAKYSGPTSFVFNMLIAPHLDAEALASFTQACGSALKLVDDRNMNRNHHQNQLFYTGLMNTRGESLKITEYERYVKLWSGKYNVQKLMEDADVILQSQTQLARSHIQRNSKRFTLKGVKVAMAEMPFLCNIGHSILLESFPDIDVSVTLWMDFGSLEENKQDNRCSLKTSYRSYTGVDVSQVAQALSNGGGGSKTCAGGSVGMSFPTLAALVPLARE